MRVQAFSVATLRLVTTPGDDLVLDAAVEALGVLADDDQVDVLVARLDARQGPHRPHGGVEVELLAQLDVDAAGSPLPTGVVTGPLSATLCARMAASGLARAGRRRSPARRRRRRRAARPTRRERPPLRARGAWRR